MSDFRGTVNFMWSVAGEALREGCYAFTPTQMPGTATFATSCGAAAALGGYSCIFARNSGLPNARLKSSTDSHTA